MKNNFKKTKPNWVYQIVSMLTKVDIYESYRPKYKTINHSKYPGLTSEENEVLNNTKKDHQ
jgi:hypothetical protein